MKKILVAILVCTIMIAGIAGGVYYAQKEFLTYLYHESVKKGKTLAFTRPAEELTFTSGGLRLCGSIYLPGGNGPFPGIVLTHGGTAAGRKLPLYQVLSKKLSQRGYVVLSFDFRGYGESENLTAFDSPDDFDFAEDVKQAVSALASVNKVDPERLFLVGHSFGAGVIIPAGIHDDRVAGMVAIAPGRRGYELFWAPDAPRKDYPRERVAQDMEIPEIRHVPVELLNPLLQYVTIDTILDFPIHPPLLLIDGEREAREDHEFLQALYQKISEPKAYITIGKADHYFGVNRDDEMAGRYYLIPYWEDIVGELVGTIDTWLAGEVNLSG